MKYLAKSHGPLFLILGFFLCVEAQTANSQEGDSETIDINFGSTRIGGQGLTASERRASAYDSSDDELPTEDNIPKVGSPKRLPHLHILAKRYTTGGMWPEACARYDQIVDESGDEGVATHPDGKKLAGKSYLKCAEKKAIIGQQEAAERLLKKSVRFFGKADYRHDTVRNNMLLESYRKKLTNRDLEGALTLFREYQSKREDEDERIRFGEQLSKLAEEAYKQKDKELMKQYISYAEQVAPRNPDLRRLKSRLETEEKAIPMAIAGGVICVFFVVFFSWFGRWRGRRKIESASGGKLGKKNKFLDDDD